MPTNKLWIEHTERAAWQSVQALREKLAEAEARAERMAPPVRGWRELFDALDAARETHALSGETYAELIRGALERLARAEADRRSLEGRLSEEPARVIPEARPVPLRKRRRDERRAFGDEDDLDADESNRSERRFFSELQKRARELGRERPRPDLDARLSQIETRLADLPELDPAEITDIAQDLGALALALRPAREPDDE
jgi:chromosome segregation ATPase